MASRTSVTRSTRLGPEQRAAAIANMRAKELDILVIGGGIVGTGAALDSVTRGLRTGMLEARDWASGTSSRSSKLVHGGIRYLEQLDFRLVREALIERGLLLQRLAPHLVKPVRFLYPLTKGLFERAYVGAGMLLYDAFSYTGGRPPGVPHHRHLTRRQLLRAAPSLHPDAFTGGLTYWDAQVDDARYVANLARTASFYGAHVASRVEVIGFLKVGQRVTGVRAKDKETGEEFEILAKQVVNATGVWTDDTQAMVGERGQFKVRASKGVHLVVPRDRFQSKLGLLLRTEKSVLFVIPWGRHWLIGTTDTTWDLDKAHPAATAADIDYLLEHVNSVLATKLTRDDVEGVYAGLRPLLAGESDETSKLSREHIVAHSVPGLVVVAGGKWTTYRVMAKDAVDEAVRATRRCDLRERDREHRAARCRRLRGRVEQAPQDREGLRRAPRASRAPAEPVRRDDRRTARPDPGRQEPRRAAARSRRLHRRRSRLRGDSRGSPAPRRRARPAHPHLDRGVGPRRRRRPRRRATHGWRARLGCRASRLPRSRSTSSAWRPSGPARSSPTTWRPTASASRRPTSPDPVTPDCPG